MARRLQKTVTLPETVVDRLEEEDNQSATVERALRSHYGMNDGENEEANA